MSNEEKERYMKEFCQEIDEEQGRATTTMKSFHGMSFMKGTPMYMDISCNRCYRCSGWSSGPLRCHWGMFLSSTSAKFNTPSQARK
jgi:hypothetical protein